MNKDEAIHKALKVLNCLNNDRVYETAWVKGAINACEKALEQPAEPRLVSYALDGSACTLNIDGEEVYFNREQPAQEVECSNHPDAPHGFCRDASHSAGRYVCECEGWQVEQPAQEPVGWLDPKQDINECFITHELKKAHEFQNSYAGNWNIPLYTHPHQWQGLTDDEIEVGIDKIEDNKNVIVDREIFIAGAYWAEKALRSKNEQR